MFSVDKNKKCLLKSGKVKETTVHRVPIEWKLGEQASGID